MRPVGRWIPPERKRARVVSMGADRITVMVRGCPETLALADFSRSTGKGLPQPKHGDMRVARQREGLDWREWSVDVPTLDALWPEWWVEHEGGWRRK